MLIAIYSLYIKEIKRFCRVYNQTLLAPVFNAVLFLFIFDIALSGENRMVGDVPFNLYVGSGLVIASAMQNSFSNPSSVIVMSKVTKTISDIIIPPFSTGGFLVSVIAAAITRGAMTALMLFFVVSLFHVIHPHSVVVMICFLLQGCWLCACLGLVAAMLSRSFEHLMSFISYVMTPLAYLSGTFYSVDNLKGFWHDVSQFNVFFYIIDGFRYGAVGSGHFSPLVSLCALSGVNLLLFIIVYVSWSRGYGIKR